MPLMVNIEFQQFLNKINTFLVFHININTISSMIKKVDFIEFFDDQKAVKISLNLLNHLLW